VNYALGGEQFKPVAGDAVRAMMSKILRRVGITQAPTPRVVALMWIAAVLAAGLIRKARSNSADPETVRVLKKLKEDVKEAAPARKEPKEAAPAREQPKEEVPTLLEGMRRDMKEVHEDFFRLWNTLSEEQRRVYAKVQSERAHEALQSGELLATSNSNTAKFIRACIGQLVEDELGE
jgi:hypothetical protein